MSTDEPIQKKRLPLELTGEEVYHLTDSVATYGVQASLSELEDRYLPLAKELLLLLGSAYVSLVKPAPSRPQGEETIYVTEDMAWLLRSRVDSKQLSSDKSENIGIPLLRKLYALLLKFNNGLDISAADVPDVDASPEQIRLAILHAEEEARHAADGTD